ncbi:30S ribosomal protein S17 [Pseudothermotoga hypogea DSM 11164 = NBRC 106472]|uniref:Small ribosomal subunit protein uS17 n=1 Tax=Pseudothermotoga hypogea DSM 11164 = NBRC 106472 TaxID=1123384 RepID=A0A0X1KP48_9THEM|nr:30S ribosomal protein S17 [Pseudothermotoga hypogea]AJC73000.1 30S ribosomal protein S17 [Pseudothermotoga hypogea DSM 11164 = NBRC 106472]MBC7123587.1 30S ribosomal protein S17 [Pseudothermotoga sp.]
MPRRRLVGVVVSDKMDKTVVVSVARWLEHPVYKKHIKRSKKYHAHDEHNECKVGDVVVIEETRPLSRTKRWRVVEILQRAYQAENIPAVEESEEA